MVWKRFLFVFLLLCCGAGPVGAGEIGPFLARELAAGPATVQVIVRLTRQPQAQLLEQGASGRQDRARRKALRRQFIEHWRDQYDPDRESVRAMLQAVGGKRLRHLWLINAFAAEVPVGAVARIAARPEVAKVELDRTLVRPPAPIPSATPSLLAVQSDHIGLLRVDDVWAQGYDGTGVTVAIVDSGVDIT
ncbi:MAG: hypothetical protein D6790_11875, partial [Caldilineae bacterium]